MQYTIKMENNFLENIYFGNSLYGTILNEEKDDDTNPIDNFETYFEQYIATGEFEEHLKNIESNIGNLHNDNPSIEDLQNNIKDVNNINPTEVNNLSNATQSMNNAADSWENLMDDFLSDDSNKVTDISSEPEPDTNNTNTSSTKPTQQAQEQNTSIVNNNQHETQNTNSANNVTTQNVSTQAQEEDDILNDMF